MHTETRKFGRRFFRRGTAQWHVRYSSYGHLKSGLKTIRDRTPASLRIPNFLLVTIISIFLFCLHLFISSNGQYSITVDVIYPDPVLKDMSHAIQSAFPSVPPSVLQPISQPVIGSILPLESAIIVSEGSRMIVFVVEAISENSKNLIAVSVR